MLRQNTSDAMTSVTQEGVIASSVSVGMPPCILLVDDDGGILSVLTELLGRFGLRIITASSPVKALDIFAQHQSEIAVVLMDYFMPVLDGGQVYDRMRHMKPSIKVIIMSTLNSLQLRQVFARRAISGYLTKPLQLSELEYAISKVLPSSKSA